MGRLSCQFAFITSIPLAKVVISGNNTIAVAFCFCALFIAALALKEVLDKSKLSSISLTIWPPPALKLRVN